MKLYVLPPSPRARKVIALKNYLGLKAEVHVLDYFRADHLKPEFGKLNPNKRMPVLEEDSWVLWESNAILFFLATKAPDSGVWPSASRDQVDVVRWLSWESSHWDPAWDILLTELIKKQIFVTRDSGRRTAGTTSGPLSGDPERIAEGTRYVQELSEILDAHLASRSWLVGDKPTIADFALASWIPSATPAGVSLDTFRAIMRWYASVAALPGWQEALPPRPRV
jgi:glutathione S-transferase